MWLLGTRRSYNIFPRFGDLPHRDKENKITAKPGIRHCLVDSDRTDRKTTNADPHCLRSLYSRLGRPSRRLKSKDSIWHHHFEIRTWTYKGCPGWRSLSGVGASSQVTPLKVLVDCVLGLPDPHRPRVPIRRPFGPSPRPAVRRSTAVHGRPRLMVGHRCHARRAAAACQDGATA